MNKRYKNIKGKLPKKNEMVDWSEEKFLSWFRLVYFLGKGEKIDVSYVTVKLFRQRSEEDAFWGEFYWRLDCDADTQGFSSQNFRNRFIRMNTNVGQYLQENPQRIDAEMNKMMKGNKYLTKYTEPFIPKTTEIGAEIVTANGNFTLPEIQYHKAILKMAGLANDLTAGISRSDINKLSPADRIRLANAIIVTMSKVVGGTKPNTQIFKQLVVNNATKEDLESAMVAHIQDNEA